jgi:Flp pilus assembly protein TadG
VLDFGRLFYAQITVENAARAGALVAARAPGSYTGDCPSAADTNKIGCAIRAESRGSGVTVGSAEVVVTCEDSAGVTVACSTDPQPNVRSRVTISKQFSFFMPVLVAILGNSVTMTASVASDQESLPPDPTALPSPTPAAGPTPTPTPLATPTPTPSSTPAATPTPSATPSPCDPGFAPMPDLVEGATDGSTQSVGEAREEWLTAGFDPSKFIPGNGSTNKTVLDQTATAGECYDVATATVTVTHS